MYDPTREYSTSVLVLGPTGAIGRAVSRELVVSGYRVYGLVRHLDDKPRLPYAVIPVVGDMKTPERWENAIRNAEVVVNCALPDDFAGVRKDRETAEREADLIADVLGGLCEFLRRKKRRLIHTFGALLYEPDADGWVRETNEISSGKGYGIRHRKGYPVFEAERKKGLRAMSVNPGFIYGRGGQFESSLLDPMSEGRSTFLGDGQQTMHYVAAADAAVGYRLAIEHGLDGHDYLLADDRPTTLGDFTRLVAKEMGAPAPHGVPVEELEPVLGAWAIEADTTCPKIDSTKAREHLGWTPRFRS
ncbi:MAG: NAD-dependent epimerase/dehydratase family protein, partial [Hyphomicrobiales bacterium]